MKLEKLVRYEEQLQELAEMPLDDAQLAWDLGEEIEKALKQIAKVSEKRDALIRENGKQDPEDPRKFLVDDITKFEPLLKKLLDVEVKINFPKVSITKLEGQKVTPIQVSVWRELGILTK